jgi:predicted nucleic acid-binding protein
LIALDTNILVYAASPHDISGRHRITVGLLARLGLNGAILPLPVVGELFNARRKKQFADLVFLKGLVEIWTAAFDCPGANRDDYLKAAQISEQSKLQYFDALIIAVAARAGAKILLSEDMQDGTNVDGLRVVNPFVVGNDGLIAAALG